MIASTPRKKPLLPRLARAGLILLAVLYLAAAAYMGINQRSFLYRVAPDWIAPETQGIPRAEAYQLTMPDGVTLRGWRIPPTRPDALTYLYFHGNARGLDRRAGRFRLMTADGSGLVALSHRGFGGSGGAPTETLLHQDAEAIYCEITKTVPPERLVIFGESLGTGISLNLARKVPTKAIILDSPYLSILARASASYPWLPVSWILQDTFRSDQWIGAVKTPILIVHGTEDRVVPVTDSEKLATLGNKATITRIVYPGEPHVVPYDRGPNRDILAFLAGLN